MVGGAADARFGQSTTTYAFAACMLKMKEKIPCDMPGLAFGLTRGLRGV